MEPDEDSDCDDTFELYRSCYMNGLLKQRQEKGLQSPSEGTMLYEFVQEQRFDDGEDEIKEQGDK